MMVPGGRGQSLLAPPPKGVLRGRDTPVPGGRDEVEAAVDSGVWDHLLPGDAHLLVQVPVKLVIHVFQDRRPAAKRNLVS